MHQTTQHSAETNLAVSTKFELPQSEVLKNSYVEEGPVHNEEKEKFFQDSETFFNIIWLDSASVVDEENRYEKKKVKINQIQRCINTMVN